MSIFSKLFKLFLTVVLMPLIPMALLLVYYQTHLKDNILETHANLAQIVSSSMNQHIEELAWRLSFAGNVDKMLSQHKNPVPALQDALAANPDFLMLAVLNKNGKELYRAGDKQLLPHVPKLDLSQDPTLPELVIHPRLSVSGFDVAQGRPVNEFLYPLKNGDYLYGIMSFFNFLARLQEQRIGNTGRIYIVDQNGDFFSGVYPYTPAVPAPALRAALTHPDGLIKKLNGTESAYVGAFAATPILGTYVAVLQKKEEAFRSINYSNIIILLFLLAIATLAYFGALSFAQSLGEPIEALSAGAAAVSAGDLDQKLEEEVGWGEFNQLMIAFNKMTTDLKDYQDLRLQAQVSEMKEHVFRAVAHDLRAPLLGLQGYLYILESGKASEAEKTEYLRLMSQAAKNLSVLLEDVLDVSRVQAGMTLPKKERIDLPKMIAHVVNTLAPVAAEKGLALSGSSVAPAVLADAKLLQRVLMNLVSNAIKFTEKGFVLIAANEDKNACFITVQDSGIGLSATEQKQIFEKYHQVQTNGTGYGLGLFISRQIVQAHGGTLAVESESGRGSLFTVTIPKGRV